MKNLLLKYLLISIMLRCTFECGIHSCEIGYRFDEGSCQCVSQLRNFCRKNCPFNMYLNNKCKCMRQKPCGLNLCLSGYNLNPNSCMCELEGEQLNCSIQSCHDGFELSQFSCKCEQSNLFTCRRLCAPGLTVYPGACQCVPERQCHIKSCSEPAIINNFCECELPQDYCDIQCPEGTEFEFPCQCVPVKPNPSPIIAPPEPDNQCKIESCREGFEMDYEFCECVEKQEPVCEIGCPFGMVVYPGNCECVNEYDCAIQTCSNPANLNVDACECEMPQDYCDIECADGTEFEFPCQCVPVNDDFNF